MVGLAFPRLFFTILLHPQTHPQIPLHRFQRRNRHPTQQLCLARLPINRLQLKRQHDTRRAAIGGQQHLRRVRRCRRSLMRGDRAHHHQFAGVVVLLHGDNQPRARALLFVSFGIQLRLERDDVPLRGNAHRISFPRALRTRRRPVSSIGGLFQPFCLCVPRQMAICGFFRCTPPSSQSTTAPPEFRATILTNQSASESPHVRPYRSFLAPEGAQARRVF